MTKKKNEMKQVLEEIKGYYLSWLTASNMTEEEFLNFRTCKHFRILLQDRVDGFAVQLIYGMEQIPIGLPFFVGFQNNVLEKEQYFENTPLILMYLAGQLDKMNAENPISGSYSPNFFKDRVKKACFKILEKGQEMLKEG